mgnify:CR=1 FL=1
MSVAPEACMSQRKPLPQLGLIRAGCSAALLLLVSLLMLPSNALAAGHSLAADTSAGQELFQKHCVGCHLNGGNIIRRGRTLKLAALERHQLNNQEAIARIAREGIGQMSGYENALGENGDQLVAAWILMQAKDSWPR